MLAPLTPGHVADLLRDLNVAFPRNLGMNNPERMAELYFRELHDFPAESVKWAAQKTIQEGEFFPKVAKLRELAHSWTKRNRFTPAFGVSNDPELCSVCGARAQQIPITRTKREWVGERLVDVIDDEGHPITETVMSQGLHMIHDRMRHGLHLNAEREGAA